MRMVIKRFLYRLPLQTAIILPFTFQVALSVGVIAFLTCRSAQITVYSIAKDLEEELSHRIVQELEELVSQPHITNQLNATSLVQGDLNLLTGEGEHRHWPAKVGCLLEPLLRKDFGQREIKDHTFRNQCRTSVLATADQLFPQQFDLLRHGSRRGFSRGRSLTGRDRARVASSGGQSQYQPLHPLLHHDRSGAAEPFSGCG